MDQKAKLMDQIKARDIELNELKEKLKNAPTTIPITNPTLPTPDVQPDTKPNETGTEEIKEPAEV